MPVVWDRARNFHIDEQGRGWCSAGKVHHKVAKRRYESIEDAWRAAFAEFVRTGESLTPAWYFRVNRMERKRRRTCGGWHLTRRHYQCLARPAAVGAQLPFLAPE